jgi:integrase
MKPSSKKRQEGIVEKLVRFFGEIQVRHITRTMVEDWAAAESKKVASRTFNYERETFVRLLDYAVREGIILDNPVRVIQRHKVRTHRPEIPTKEQFKTMLETIATLRADAMPSIDLCELLAYSGCRLNEATALTWGDIDFEQKRFTVTGGETGTKNHEARVVPLFPSLENLLKRILDRYSESPAPSVPVVSIKGSRTAMISACRRADLPRFSHHHLRHFFCSNAIEAGIDFKTIAGWLGHKDGGLLVAKTYGHLRDEHSAIMAQRMTFGVM